MPYLRRFLSRLYNVFRPSIAERELSRELQCHLLLLEDEYIERGMSRLDAARAARRAVGSLELAKDLHREARSFTILEDIRRDVAYACRTLRRTPLPTTIAILSLALGIGATTAVYSTTDWLLSRSPRAVMEPNRILSLQVSDRAHPDIGTVGLSFLQYRALLEFQDAFVGLAAYGKLLGVVASDAGADQAVFEYDTGNYFDVLGVRAARGRTFRADDDVPGAAPVAMLSYAFWQSRFRGDPAILDRLIRLNGQSCRVIGIVPAAFEGYNLDWNGPTAVWMPVQTAEAIYKRKIHESAVPFVRVVGRLRPAMTQAMVEQRASVWMKRLPYGRSGTFEATNLVVRPGSEMRIRYRDGTARVLRILFEVCILILLAACLNVANFLLNRGVLRRRELAVRASIGATRTRILRQLLTEVLVLTACATAVGVIVAVCVAYALAPLHRMFLGVTAGDLSSVGAIDIRMGAVAAVVGFLSAAVFGLMPAVVASWREPFADLKQSIPQWTWSRFRLNARQALLILQISVGVALAIPAGLYGRSFLNIASVMPVYGQPASVLVATVVAPPRAGIAPSSFFDQLLASLRANPEVVSATLSGAPPLMAGTGSSRRPDGESRREHAVSLAGPAYFTTQGVAIVAGRDFSDSEADNGTAIIVNEVLAHLWWPNRNPVGSPLMVGNDNQLRVVSGVVADNSCADFLSEPMPCAWVPFNSGFSGTSAYVQIRTRRPPVTFVPELRSIVSTLNGDAAVANETTLATLIHERSAVERFSALASVILAAAGIALLAIGSLALFLSMVRDSVRELAIRIALGADHVALTLRILGQGLLLLAVGDAIGLTVGRVLGLRIADQLHYVAPTDTLTFAVVAILIPAIGLLSISAAASAATHTSPTTYLRQE